MTVEYILLIAMFVFVVMGALVSAPQKTFEKAGPKLGARVEKHLITGQGWGKSDGSSVAPIGWK
jgi:hypothetical protein